MHLDDEIARCKRENATAAILVCDLNGFKKINDRYGHLAGDKVLKLFAKSVREVCRDTDYAARMGGDEFVIVAPNMTPNAVSERIALLSSLAQEAGREACGSDLLSLSAGVAFYPQEGQDTEKLLSEADRMMYAAKALHYDNFKLMSPDLARRAHLAAVN
jgi:diguanylate cyclase (GGDEF)-like protein